MEKLTNQNNNSIKFSILKHWHLLIALFMLMGSYTASAQWLKNKGKGYYKLSAWYLEADEHYTSNGQTDPNATRGLFNLSFYGEYGISDKFNTMFYLPFFARTFQNDQISGTTGEILAKGEAVNSIGDTELGIKYGILQKGNWKWSVSLKLGVPTGNNKGGSDGSYQTGDGEFNQYLKSAIGRSFSLGSLGFYASLHTGYNNRTKGFSDEWRSGLELGNQTIKDKLWLIVKGHIVKSLKNGNLNAENTQGNIFANNVEYTNLGLEVNYFITKKIGVSLNYTAILAGHITYAAPSYSAGLFLVVK